MPRPGTLESSLPFRLALGLPTAVGGVPARGLLENAGGIAPVQRARQPRLAEEGAHAELVARGGRYAEMFETQAAAHR